MSSKILRLSQIISESVTIIEQCCGEDGLIVPDLDRSLTNESETFRSNIRAADAADVAAAASIQLLATLLPPSISVFQAACGHLTSAALRVCLESNVVEILREAGPTGLAVHDIALRNGLHAGKLARLLRYLATRNIFREISPDVFVNNRLSSVLDTQKSVDLILSQPEQKHDDTNGFSALAELFAGDLHKSSSYLLENMQDPNISKSDEPNHAPLNRAFGIDVSLFEWYDRPEQIYRLRRFITAMEGTNFLQADDGLLTAMDWGSLPAGSSVVDVGGGSGKVILPIAKLHPHLTIVIQDRAIVVEKSEKTWETSMTLHPAPGIRFQAHDFFTPQPIKDAAVFVLKHIIHGFSDPYATKILKNLREAATPITELLIIDSIIPHVCSTEDLTPANSRSIQREAPFPILPNYGPIKEMAYISDLTMMLQLNAQERTLSQMTILLHRAGWKIVEVCPAQGSVGFLQLLKALPW